MIIKSVILQWILLRYNAKATSTGGLRVSHVLSAHHYTGSARYMRVGLPSYLINATFIMILKVASAIALTAFTVMPHEPLPNLAIGSPMPAADVKMKDVGGKDLSLTDIMGKNGLLVVFSCNTCPFVIGSEGSEGWEGRYPELAAYSQRYGVGIVFVNSNEAKRDDGDGFADMQARYKEKKYSGSYVLDAGNAVADAFGARTTPHVFLRSSTNWTASGREDRWQPLEAAQVKSPPPPALDASGDWLAAVAQDREPECSAVNAAWAVEMVMAVYASALEGGRPVTFPLKSRKHPLSA